MNADWQPLERLFGASLCADFMFMGRAEQIHLYKHKDTRDGISTLPQTGHAFATQLDGYQPIELEEAIEYVFH